MFIVDGKPAKRIRVRRRCGEIEFLDNPDKYDETRVFIQARDGVYEIQIEMSDDDELVRKVVFPKGEVQQFDIHYQEEVKIEG
jgi:hypothetical protein